MTSKTRLAVSLAVVLLTLLATGPTSAARAQQGPCLGSSGLAICAVDDSVNPNDPAGAPTDDEATVDALGRQIWLKPRVWLTSDDVSEAHADYDPVIREPCVKIVLTKSGDRHLAALTTMVVGHPIAVLEDGEVVATPKVESPVLGGGIELLAGFTTQSAEAFARRVMLGKGGIAS